MYWWIICVSGVQKPVSKLINQLVEWLSESLDTYGQICTVKIGISFGVDNVGWHQNLNHSKGWGTRQKVKGEIGIITTFFDVDK